MTAIFSGRSIKQIQQKLFEITTSLPKGAAAFICLSIMLICTNAIVYPRASQHDAWLHLSILKGLYSLTVEPTYNAVYYYLFVALISSPLLPLTSLDVIENDFNRFHSISVLVSGSMLWFVFFLGLYKTYLNLGFERQTAFLCAAATAVLPPIMRTYAMIRLENLILTLSPYLYLYASRLLSQKHLDTRTLAKLSIVVGLCASQKVTGIVLVLWLLAAVTLLHNTELQSIGMKFRLRILFSLLFSVVLLLFLNYLATETWIFEHHAESRADYTTKIPSLANLTALNIPTVWANPLRFQFPISLPNILAVDFFGDYWGYGINHLKLPISPDFRVIRARASLILTGLYCVIFVLGFFLAMRHALHRPERSIGNLRTTIIIPILSATIFVGLALISLVSFKFWHAGKGDTFKWEYIIMFTTFAYLPLGVLIEKHPKTRMAAVSFAYFFIIAGFIQSAIIVVTR